jgi:hypothetical protein
MEEFNRVVVDMAGIIYDVAKENGLSEVSNFRLKLNSLIEYTPFCIIDKLGPKLYEYRTEIDTLELDDLVKLHMDIPENLMDHVNAVHHLLSDDEKSDVLDCIRAMLRSYMRYMTTNLSG